MTIKDLFLGILKIIFIIITFYSISYAMAGLAICFIPHFIQIPGLAETLHILDLFSYRFMAAAIILGFLPLTLVIFINKKVIDNGTSRDIKLIIAGIILVIGSFFYTGYYIVDCIKRYEKKAIVTETIPLETTSDTLYIGVSAKYKDAIQSKGNSGLFKLEGTPDSWFYIDTIFVEASEDYDKFELEIRKKGYAADSIAAQQIAEKAKFNFEIVDSLIVLFPETYSIDEKWDGTAFELIIHSPYYKQVDTKGLQYKRKKKTK